MKTLGTFASARTFIGAGLLSTVAACATTRPISSPDTFVLERRPSAIQVTLVDGSRKTMWRPQVLGDTLVGWIDGEYQELPPSSIVAVAARRVDPLRTGLLTASIAAATVTLLLVTKGSGESPDPGIEYRTGARF